MARGVFELLQKLSKLPEDESLEELRRICNTIRYKGRIISDHDILAIHNELFIKRHIKYTQDLFESRNVLEIFSKDLIRDIFLEIVREHQTVEMAGETDEPVTTDVKRLIRLPTSLHGKTGFRAVPLDIDDLQSFDPLSDALAFGKEPVKVNVTAPETVKFRLGGEDFSSQPGETELPEFAAIYLMCQRKAEIV
jgi:DNA primase catalytic subunit